MSGTAPTVTYIPAANYNGPDAFTFKVKDTNTDSNVASVNLTVTSSVWTPIGPEGGRVFTVVVDQTNPLLLYAGTGGGVFRSTDGGLSWSPSNTGLTSLSVTAIVIHPTTRTTLYAGTHSGVFKSTDGGTSWTGATAYPFVTAMAIDPITPTMLYASSDVGGVFKSMDGGASWTASNSGLSRLSVHAMAMDLTTPSTLYVAIDGGGVFKSTNAGGNWSASSIGLPTIVRRLAIDPVTPTTVYAGSYDSGMFKSTDAGASWITSSAGLTNGSIYAITIDPTEPFTLYVGTEGGGVFKSTNAGATWSDSDTGITNTSVSALAVDAASPATVYAGTGKGLFKSTNGGAIWDAGITGLRSPSIDSVAVDPVTPTTIYAGTEHGIFKTTNGGTTWSTSGTGLTARVNVIAIDPTVPTTLYAATNGVGVYKSVNGGANWSAAGLTSQIFAFAIDPITPMTVYAGTTGGVFKSIDGGANWGAANTGWTNGVFALLIDPLTPSTLYAGSPTGGVFKSINSGANWTASNAGLTNMSVYAMAIDPMTPTTLYAGTQLGSVHVFKSTNGGASWTRSGDGLPSPFMVAMAIDPTIPTTLYAGTSGSGSAFKTTNGGTSWNTHNIGLTNPFVTSLVIDPQSPTRLYAGTRGGLFILEQAGNDTPTANSQSVTLLDEVSKSITLTGSDPDGGLLTFSIVSPPSHGTLSGSAPNVTYTPAASYFGPDSFTFKANDGALDSNVATVNVTINSSAPLTVTVLAPNGGEKVFLNVPTTIRWSSGGTPASFDVALSRNAGTTFTPIAGCVGLPGSAASCAWTPIGGGSATAVIRVTAQNGSGTVVDSSNANFTIATAAPSITVTSPNTAVNWAVGSTRSINWNHNLGANSFVRIELSRDGNTSWETLATSVQNTAATSGMFSWVVSAPTTGTATIRVTWVDGATSDVSNSAFSITIPSLTITAPNTNVGWLVGSRHNVAWSHNLGTSETVKIEVSRNGGTTWDVVTPSTANSSIGSGVFGWLVVGPVTSTARMRVTWTNNTGVQDVSDVDFRIRSAITVTSPNTAITWAAGSTRTITWNHNYGVAQLFDIAFSPDNGASWSPVTTGVPAATATSGVYTGAMPTSVTTQGLVRVSPAGNPGDGDMSNVPFTLAPPRITVTAPNTNVNWTVGSTRIVRWNHNLGTAENVNIEVSRDGGSTFTPIASALANASTNSGMFNWVVSGPASSSSRIRVIWTSDGVTQDVSDVNFRIQ